MAQANLKYYIEDFAFDVSGYLNVSGLSVMDMHHATGIAMSSCYRLISTESNPRIDTFLKVCSFCKLNPGDYLKK